MAMSQEKQDSDRKSEAPAELSPALVQKVADRVYALLLRDLELERERQRSMIQR